MRDLVIADGANPEGALRINHFLWVIGSPDDRGDPKERADALIKVGLNPTTIAHENGHTWPPTEGDTHHGFNE